MKRRNFNITMNPIGQYIFKSYFCVSMSPYKILIILHKFNNSVVFLTRAITEN